ncbi:MAG: hypothetical protein LBF08_05410 [Dysgonamonadaceae bacterium]|jgi:hypothetical protein|nr:hypothetical protein [Dysgonamonadaceae bacterium]
MFPYPVIISGKEIEIILYPMDEIESMRKINRADISRFKGILTAEEADTYHQYLKTVRQEWNRDI